MLPLDKMNTRPISHEILKTAQKLVGKNNVYRAIDLVEFDNRFEPAMNHIFGGVLVCSNLDIANQASCTLKIFSLVLKT